MDAFQDLQALVFRDANLVSQVLQAYPYKQSEETWWVGEG